MAVIASLAVALTARTEEFSTGLRKARRELSRFARDIPFANTSVAKFGAILASGVAAGLAVTVKRSLEEVDALAKLAERTGVSVEALARLRVAAEDANLPMSSLATSLQQLAIRSADAASGTGPAAGALQKLELNAKSFAALALDRKLEVIADGMTRLGSAGERLNVAMDLFGRGGLEMVNLLGKGSEGLKAAAEQAEKLGLALTGVDVARVEQAGDALDRLRFVTKGLGEQLTVALAPFIEGGVNRFVDALNQGGTAAEKVDAALQKVFQTMAVLLDVVMGLRAGWNLFSATVRFGIAGILTPLDIMLDRLVLVAETFGVEIPNSVRFAQNIAESFTADAAADLAEAGQQIADAFSSTSSRRLLQSLRDVRAEGLGAAQTRGLALTGGAPGGAAATGTNVFTRIEDGIFSLVDRIPARTGGLDTFLGGLGRGAEGIRTLGAELGESIREFLIGGTGATGPESGVGGLFQQFDPSRIDVRGLRPSNAQYVSDDRTHQILGRIERKLGSGEAVAVAG